MSYRKSAAPCEVCGDRVKHAGSERGFVVGYTTKAVKRLVHEKCRRLWEAQGRDIRSKWVELRPEVLRTLPQSLQARIQRCVKVFEGGDMPRKRATEVFQFPPQVYEWVREKIKLGKRKKGAIKDWHVELLVNHHDWMVNEDRVATYTDFYQLLYGLEMQMKYEQNLHEASTRSQPELPAVTPIVSAPLAAPIPSESTQSSIPETPPTQSVESDLAAMANVAHALIDLALKRNNRVALQDALEILAPDLLKPKTTIPPPAS